MEESLPLQRAPLEMLEAPSGLCNITFPRGSGFLGGRGGTHGGQHYCGLLGGVVPVRADTGADWAYAITAGLQHRSVLPSVGGLLVGHLAATVVVAAGVGALVARSSWVLTALTVAGSVYLVWLGVNMFARPSAPRASYEQVAGSWVQQAAKGAGISGLNPKVFLLFLLFLALLPQFVDPATAWSPALQIVVLGLVHVASCAVIYTAVGAGARVVLRTRPAATRAVTRFSGVAMVGIGALLLVERLVH